MSLRLYVLGAGYFAVGLTLLTMALYYAAARQGRLRPMLALHVLPVGLVVAALVTVSTVTTQQVPGLSVIQPWREGVLAVVHTLLVAGLWAVLWSVRERVWRAGAYHRAAG